MYGVCVCVLCMIHDTLDMYPGPGLVADLQHSLSYIILSPPTSVSPCVGDLK